MANKTVLGVHRPPPCPGARQSAARGAAEAFAPVDRTVAAASRVTTRPSPQRKPWGDSDRNELNGGWLRIRVRGSIPQGPRREGCWQRTSFVQIPHGGDRAPEGSQQLYVTWPRWQLAATANQPLPLRVPSVTGRKIAPPDPVTRFHNFCRVTSFPIDVWTIYISSQSRPEGIRMVRRLIRNQLPRKGLRVRVPCPPLFLKAVNVTR